MESIPIYQVDAFTDNLFGGNPAAVCILESEIDESLMQQIAAENNLAETAFVIPQEGFASIRYFTPLTEVALCGHATLASAFVLSEFVQKRNNQFTFETMLSGRLTVEVRSDLFALNLPADQLKPEKAQFVAVADILGHQPVELFHGRTDLMAVFDDQQILKEMEPDMKALARLNARGLIVAAPGNESDFVTRFFAPAIGVDEDPVTGSAHTSLVPYWSQKLNKTSLVSHQLSARGGVLYCRDLGNRTEVAGKATLYLKGEIFV
ncbi:putative isomerase YddE [Salinivirga cyanobacteriivorans]|uniref:Putative isomerase YddE n=1 Tax=Salinivirga cyanobacteriivorans TaxID=1307839 RepID=A0A0S2I1T7_9BACT|nr:PhzF family phenazine biosynthesis protein [Salinivirga cyanobacteriivorans]ALO16149.1 putative isomerase YddE [Salinivirga cyanobacteriivorans]